MRLSDLKPEDVQPVSDAPLKLSELHPDDVQPVVGPGYFESAARGAAQGATFGFADEISGAGLAAADAAKKLSVSDIVKDYVTNRNAYRSADRAASEANPYTYGAGQVAGGLGSAFAVPGVAAAGLGGAVATGALQGYGGSESGEPVQQIKDMGLGGAIGGAGYGAGKLASKYIPTAAEAKDYARKKVIEHLRPTPKIARVLGPERLGQVADEVLDNGLVGFGEKAGNTAQRIAGAKDTVGQEIGQYIDEATASGKTVNPVDIANRFENEVIAPLRGQAENRGLVKSLEKQKSDLLAHYSEDGGANQVLAELFEGGALPQGALEGISAPKMLTPLEVEQEKRAVQGNINYLTDPKAAQEARRGYANVLKNTGEEVIDNVKFPEAKARYSKLSDAQMMADRTAGLTDSGTGLLGHLHDISAEQAAMQAVLHGEPVTGAAIGAGRALVRGRTASALGVGANETSKFLSTNPTVDAVATGIKKSLPQVGAAFGREEIMRRLQGKPGAQKYQKLVDNAASKGPESLATMTYLLSQTEPEFSEAFTEPTH